MGVNSLQDCCPTAFTVFTGATHTVLAMSVCLSVRLSVRHKPVLYRHDRNNPAGFGMEAFFHLCHAVW